MGKLGIKERGKAWVTVLLAFLLPGMGHVYNGQYSKGFLLLAGLLLDYTAIFRLANSDGGRHLLLIVYLSLMLPIFYFISVFDALQSVERGSKEHSSIRFYHGVCLIVAGVTMLILIKPPTFMEPWMNELAEWTVGPLLILIATLLINPIRRGAITMFKLGRITAAVLVITVGALLVWDLWKERNDIATVGEWWPVVFIILGLEVILYSTVLHHKAAKLRLDVAGISAAIVIAVMAYAVTQYAEFPVRWLDQFNVDLKSNVDYGEEKGFRYDKNVVKIPFDQNIHTFRILNVNGDITVRSDDVDEIELYTTVWVDVEDKVEATAIAEQSIANISPGEETLIEGKGHLHGDKGNRLPKMNLEIVIPIIDLASTEVNNEETVLPESNQPTPSTTSQVKFPIATNNAFPTPTSSDVDNGVDVNVTNAPESVHAIKLEIESGNGAVTVNGVNAQDGVVVKSNSGLVKLANIHGPVNVAGNNSSIEAYTVVGKTNLETKNGSIIADLISEGELFASTLNGDLDLNNVQGDLDAETKNGKINVLEAKSALKADTLNGSIQVESSSVGGNWDIDSSVGEIKLSIPELGDYSVNGSVTFGNITTDFPFEKSRKSIKGAIGNGTYRIHINATNSISISRHIVSS
ncbi:DUF4097 family beta strand repeat-containing protein [Paenibacillus sp. L3-i20]|uniref:DUF4097 family beta strand repeat-containing protein n=1 Tax=Paenibacillus sp. L3-i20 TaxID=2905833 RepID=UPI001EDD5DF9|nr:DUF6677 family protein [Paenibacillus sp. L3-i20]GKU76092.1 hypothetical protein L3i20_v204890 [Paenibacillus sp. L3-i20]